MISKQFFFHLKNTSRYAQTIFTTFAVTRVIERNIFEYISDYTGEFMRGAQGW